MPIKTKSAPFLASRIKLFLPGDLEEPERTRELAESDRNALRAAADWIKAFVARQHGELGRPGPVCPFVPPALERRTLWLAAERIAACSVPDISRLMDAYKARLLAARPIDGDDANHKSIVVVFTDLPAARAKDFFADLLQQIAVPSYVHDGLAMGPFYEGNDSAAIYNPHFRPFTPPVPFLLIRNAVISDWKFFLNNDDWLTLWARRYGESAVDALAKELRRLPWRAQRESAPPN